MAKQLSKQQYLQAFALYTLAGQHYKKCREFERGLACVVGAGDKEFEYNLSDGIYKGDDPEPFDQVLKMSGYTVVEET